MQSQKQVVQGMFEPSGYVSFGHHSDSEGESDEEDNAPPQPQDQQQIQPPPQQEQQDQQPQQDQQAHQPDQQQQPDPQPEPQPQQVEAAAEQPPPQPDPQQVLESDDDSEDDEPIDERAVLRQLFPNLPEDFVMAPAPQQLNCHGYSVGLDYAIIGAEGGRTRQQMRDGMEQVNKNVVSVQEADFAAANVVWYGTGADQILHSARKLGGGRWSSKMGAGPIIEHTLAQLNGGEYGNALYFAQIADAEH
jgi:hypothetical protein